ncbi:hypothetical protein EFER_2417 [Escherichia fergusonii ATCC 35469]|uniref:Uncharacterized protein n=1 Tax=Escherichia fergusonii (strain ATCC 35469 / DSM 13698 / CCUG 18766 / IAM 14443 / JCM 21226 / LMG 7866 / NBRC 102419 / NCTC 12128 / CDC 0568-73) TaxID=585054 RepID=B7LKS1_ESCF3|nr:hypothetical protein VK87_0211355 [Escherichia fergusonii]KWW02536.1 hypothetical protein VP22_0202535 [Escherichia fergusonii]CAQ89916.1 hypothetical protein EFER_2417 [Escherichia fergusonii ATCC 35469]
MLKARETCTLGCPLVRRLAGIKEMKVKTITMGKLHDMGCPPYMRHCAAIIFHFPLPFAVSVEGRIILSRKWL